MIMIKSDLQVIYKQHNLRKASSLYMFIIFLATLTEEQQDLLEQLFKKHHLNFLRISNKILKSEDKANDVVSTSYIKIMNNIEKILSLSHTETIAYCVTIVKNTSLDLIRSETRASNFITSQDFKFEQSSAESKAFEIYENKRLLEILQNISREEQLIVQMKYLKNLHYREIADILGISEDAARKRGQRTLKKLKLLYEKGESDD